MLAAFGTPGFARLYLGLVTSMFGDSVMLLVLSMWVKDLTGSNGLAGLTFFFMVLPSLLAPLLGVVIDRFRRKAVLVWGNVASAVGILALVTVRDAGDVWIIWLVAVGYGASFVVLPAALNGLLKDMVADDLLVDANASLQTTKEAFRLVGPLIGAALFAWTGGWMVAVVDSISFALAAVTIATISVREVAPEHDDGSTWQRMTAGVAFLAREKVLRHVVVGFAMMMVVLGFFEAAIYAVLDFLDLPVTAVSWFVSAQGVGAVVVGLLAGRLVRRIGETGALVVGMAMLALSVVAITAVPFLVPILVSAAVMGGSLPLIMIATNTLVQRRTPGALMGRVSTALEVVMASPQAISLALGSLLVTLLDWRLIFVLVAAFTAMGATYIAVLLRHHIRAEVTAGRHPVALAEPVVVDPLEPL